MSARPTQVWVLLVQEPDVGPWAAVFSARDRALETVEHVYVGTDRYFGLTWHVNRHNPLMQEMVSPEGGTSALYPVDMDEEWAPVGWRRRPGPGAQVSLAHAAASSREVGYDALRRGTTRHREPSARRIRGGALPLAGK